MPRLWGTIEEHMAWIKLVVHPEHDKILALADLTGMESERVFAAVVRWFRWVDEHGENGSIEVSAAAFRAITRWPDDRLAAGMAGRVDWLRLVDGKYRPTRFDSHFGQSAKRRALDAARKAGVRKMSAPKADKSPQCPQATTEERREDKDSVCVGADVDPRIGEMMGVGIAWGIAGKIIRDHNPTVEQVRQYAEMSAETTVHNRAAYVVAAIKGSYAPRQAGSKAKDEQAVDEAIQGGFALAAKAKAERDERKRRNGQ
mgnify:CR=1 FL=1